MKEDKPIWKRTTEGYGKQQHLKAMSKEEVIKYYERQINQGIILLVFITVALAGVIATSIWSESELLTELDNKVSRDFNIDLGTYICESKDDKYINAQRFGDDQTVVYCEGQNIIVAEAEE